MIAAAKWCAEEARSASFVQLLLPKPQKAMTQPRTPDAEPSVPNCPKCEGPMWDNREGKRNPKAPDFK